MHRPRHLPSFTAALAASFALAAAAVPFPPAAAQQRDLVSSQVEVSGNEASLRLEFADGQRLALSFHDGIATLDGETLGTYEPGDATDRAWRSLLAEVLSLSDGPLAHELDRWSPDPGIEGQNLELLYEVDGVLAGAVTGAGQPPSAQPADQEQATIEEFLSRVASGDNLAALGMALEDLDLETLDIRIGPGHSVGEGVTFDGSILVVDGDIEVEGRVAGDVVVLDGVLTLGEGGLIEGDVRHARSRIARLGGSVGGDVVDLVDATRAAEAVTTEALAARLMDAAEAQARAVDAMSEQPPTPVWSEQRGRDRQRGTGYGWRALRAVGGVLEAIVTFLVIAGLTLLLTRFAGLRVDSVTREVGYRPGRAAAVGFAGGFLLLPVFVIGIVALAISLVGIPLLAVWIPLFPLAVCLAGFMGYVGVGHHVGQWVLDQGHAWLDRVDGSRATHVRLTGLAVMLLPFAVGSALGALPFVGWIGGVVKALGGVAWIAAGMIGFGAVIITRGGRHAMAWPANPDDELETAAEWSPVDEERETQEHDATEGRAAFEEDE